MNKEQMVKAKANDPDYDKNVKTLKISEIKFDHEISQVRAKGHNLHTAKNFTRQFEENKGWISGMPPITIDHEFNVREGNTRAIGAAEYCPDMDVLVYQPPGCEGWPEQQWRKYQAQANDHCEQNANTKEDIVSFVAESVVEMGLELNNNKNYPVGAGQQKQELYIGEIVSHLKGEIFKNSSLTRKSFQSIVRKALEKNLPAPRFNNPSNTDILQRYRAETGSKTTMKVGHPKSSQGPIVRILRPTRLVPNIEGYIANDLRKGLKNPIDLIVTFDTALSTLSPRSFIESRINLVEEAVQLRAQYNRLYANNQVRNIYVVDQIPVGTFNEKSPNKITLVTADWCAQQRKYLK